MSATSPSPSDENIAERDAPSPERSAPTATDRSKNVADRDRTPDTPPDPATWFLNL